MDKAHREKIIIASLLAVLVGAVLYSKARPVQSAVRVMKSAVAMNIEDVKEKLSAFGARTEQKPIDKEYRDVFKMPELPGSAAGQEPARAGQDAGQSLVLQGVIWNGRQDLAIISGQVVSEGEYVSDAKVMSITERGVILQRGGSKIELTRQR